MNSMKTMRVCAMCSRMLKLSLAMRCLTER